MLASLARLARKRSNEADFAMTARYREESPSSDKTWFLIGLIYINGCMYSRSAILGRDSVSANIVYISASLVAS